jgi:nucleoid DNA-binding protein
MVGLSFPVIPHTTEKIEDALEYALAHINNSLKNNRSNSVYIETFGAFVRNTEPNPNLTKFQKGSLRWK